MYNPDFFRWNKINDIGGYKSIEFDKKILLKKSNLPITPGCYIWKIDGVILYIGRSSNIRNRLGDHIFGKISGFSKNAIYNTTARDTIMRHLFPDHNHQKFSKYTKVQKEQSTDYMQLWDESEQMVARSTFEIFSTKTSYDSEVLERHLIIKYSPITNNVLPNTSKERNDEIVLGFKCD